MKTSVCIVGGCGHIGLPLGLSLAQAGAIVTLLDLDEGRVRQVDSGRMPFVERGADDLLPAVLATGRLQVTTSAEALCEADAVVVTIGTPVDEFMDPGLRSFDRSIDGVLDEMRDGQLLILRSTVFPESQIASIVERRSGGCGSTSPTAPSGSPKDMLSRNCPGCPDHRGGHSHGHHAPPRCSACWDHG